jgi:hypothetical protein
VSAGRRLLTIADALPVTVLAAIAGAGSFTHIRDTAAEHGQGGPMSWAVAVCIDLTCVMAARERPRDKQQGLVTRRLSWPTAVLAGGILLSLAANLAQAQPTAWGRIVAAVPPAAFLVAVSMIERRAAGRDDSAGEASAPGRPSPVPDAGDEARDAEDAALLTLARRAAAEHQGAHGQPITRDALRARLGVSNQAASELLRQLRAGEGQPPGTSRAALPQLPSPRRPAPPGPRSAGRLPNVARLDRHREGVATYRDGLAAHGPAGRSPPARPARDGQRKWQTVYPGSRTCDPSMSPANLLANTYSCRHRSPISVADVLDTAVINLPVDSQTCISAKLLKQSLMAGRTCVTYVNSLSVVRGNVSVQYQVPAPRSVPACPRLPGTARAYGQLRAGARGGRRAARAGAERRPARRERREAGR